MRGKSYNSYFKTVKHSGVMLFTGSGFVSVLLNSLHL